MSDGLRWPRADNVVRTACSPGETRTIGGHEWGMVEQNRPGAWILRRSFWNVMESWLVPSDAAAWRSPDSRAVERGICNR